MEGNKYKVLINGVVCAENMDIKTAIILVRALFEEYYNDHLMEISIMEMERAFACGCVGKENDKEFTTRRKCDTCKTNKELPAYAACAWFINNVVCGNKTTHDCPEYISCEMEGGGE